MRKLGNEALGREGQAGRIDTLQPRFQGKTGESGSFSAAELEDKLRCAEAYWKLSKVLESHLETHVEISEKSDLQEVGEPYILASIIVSSTRGDGAT